MQKCAKSWGVLLAKSVNPSAPRGHLRHKSGVVWKLPSGLRGGSASLTTRGLRTSAAAASSRRIERILPRHDDFAERHIGPGEREKRDMLDVLGLEVRRRTKTPKCHQHDDPTAFRCGHFYFIDVCSQSIS